MEHKIYKILLACILSLVLFCLGVMIGKTIAIRQATLVNTTENGHHIQFGTEVHEYTFE